MFLNCKFLFVILFLPFLSLQAFPQTFTSSNLPLVFLNTNGQTIADDPKINATMGIVWNGPGKRNALTDPKNDYNGNIAIEKRGSSSQNFPKKSYGFETKSSAWADLNASLLGMPSENDWILYAPYTDKTMIRDVLTYTLNASLGHYTPRCRYVELFLNGAYQGVYVLMEKIKWDKGRLNIVKMLPTDNTGENLTGGYIIKIDKTTGGSGIDWQSTFINNTKYTGYQYHYPKLGDITFQQKSYIQKYVRDMETALYYERFEGTGNYHQYLNDASFIDFMIINEMSRNVDGYRLSSYLYKDRNGLMNCGPIWDFNLTYGNANYFDGWLTTGYVFEQNLGNDLYEVPFWWKKLMRDPAYVLKLKKRWSWIRKHELSNERIGFVTDSLVNLLSEAQVRNYQCWPYVIGYYVWPNKYIGPSYEAEVTSMKDWLQQRLAFLDGRWYYNYTDTENPLAVNSYTVHPNPFTDQLTIQLPSSLNGSAYAELFNQSGMLIRNNPVEIHKGQIKFVFERNNILMPGLYVIRITQNHVVLFTGKIVKRP